MVNLYIRDFVEQGTIEPHICTEVLIVSKYVHLSNRRFSYIFECILINQYKMDEE